MNKWVMLLNGCVYLGLDSRLESKDLSLIRDLQNNDHVLYLDSVYNVCACASTFSVFSCLLKVEQYPALSSSNHSTQYVLRFSRMHFLASRKDTLQSDFTDPPSHRCSLPHASVQLKHVKNTSFLVN